MHLRRRFAIAGAAVLVIPLVITGLPASAISQTALAHREVPVCTPSQNQASCDAIIYEAVSQDKKPVINSGPVGYTATDLQDAYSLSGPSSTNGSTQTIGIVDAYNAPNIVSDLAHYRNAMGLADCAAGSGCLTVMNQDGSTSASDLPPNNGGWAQEISLDVEMAAAICPLCKILLVEANSTSMSDLGTAENTAVANGATVISNSWSAQASSYDTNFDEYFNHPGVAITAASGDSGYGAQYPAASQYVTAVGGTSLVQAQDGTWSETAWSGSGSGCSTYDQQPTWQSNVTNITTLCPTGRAIADVSATADPRHGVAVYDSYRYRGLQYWLAFGGTSVASPIIASVYALAGNSATVDVPASLPYANDTSGNLYDITHVTKTRKCHSAICISGPGWDGPTGLGSPIGIGAF